MAREDFGDTRRSNANEERIFVAIRIRPLNENEIVRQDVSAWNCIDGNTIRFKNNPAERSSSMDTHTFDKVFGDDCSTQQVYEEGIKEIALSVVSGVNSSIFAYGQTSSGKTYTMTGITEYAVRDIYDYTNMHKEREFVLKFSAMEIYNEAVRDLLMVDSAQLRLLDDPEKGTIIEKLTEETLTEWSDLQKLLSICAAERTTEETSMNESSSRSHQIIRLVFTLWLHCLTVESSPNRYAGAESSGTLVASVNFVDLAGSERASQAMTAGARLREGSHINRSLLTLGTVIRKLSKERNGHIPYRESKLTRILHNSLGGNARTAIICTINPARSHVEQSRNTLLFAGCAKQVATNAQVNVVMTDKVLVQQLRKELARMENELRNLAPNTVLLERELLIKQMDEEIKELTRQRDIFQSRVETLLQSGKHQFLRNDKDSNPISPGVFNNLHPDQDPGCGSSTENPDRPISGVVLNNDEDHARQRENHDPKVHLDGNNPKFVGPDSDPGWDAMAEGGSAESEDSCTEVRCTKIEEVKTGRQTGVDSSFHSSEEREGKSPLRVVLNGDAESSLRRKDGKLNHVAEDDSSDALKQKIQELQKTIDRLVGLSEKSKGSSESPLAISRRVPFSRSKSCRPTLAATSSHCNKVDREIISRAQVPELVPKSPRFDNLELKTVSTFQFNKLDQKSEPPLKFYEPMSSSKLDALEQEANASAARVEKECSTTSARFEDKLSKPKLHYKKRKSSRNHSRTRGLDTIGEVESLMDSDAEDTASVLNFVVEMKTRSEVTPLKKDFDDLMVMAKASGFNDRTDRAKSINFGEMPNSMLPYKFEGLQRYIIELWHTCHVPLVHRSYFLLLLKGELPDSAYLNAELRRLSSIKDAFSSGNKFVGEDGRNISPDSSLKAINRERKMLSKLIHKKFASKERYELYQKWCIDVKTKHRSVQLAWRVWTNTEDLYHVRESAMLVAKLVGLIQSDDPPKKTLGFSFFGRIKSKKSQDWKDARPVAL
ncbi:kinesin-like protein KIN-7F [Neltuma alba]|uniref:kinesin-like protein KIN-7F n=1 Tax=Neltuma alba TaxID=207710 RepID=UPI0010A47868|nr:kinesin-like protein KIN-7F [Prosopis alba]